MSPKHWAAQRNNIIYWWLGDESAFFAALEHLTPAGHYCIIIESTLQNPSERPAVVFSIKGCLDKSAYTDSSQQD